MHLPSPKIAVGAPAPPVARFGPGDYVRAARNLYYVEHIGEIYAVLEDCRTGEPLHVSIADLVELELVRRARS
jgi:hypothetical protein